eukprot:TRINITY_DN15600_c0_g1_i1.p1 TRINITY_DN15600_c0_g1~~TRINITY_DN15600_c0_g1_i1.p1  ORF type:complete len:198 (-),score=26.59 TRINITY_DN15600_c0_g1_i1:233-826(-)
MATRRTVPPAGSMLGVSVDVWRRVRDPKKFAVRHAVLDSVPGAPRLYAIGKLVASSLQGNSAYLTIALELCNSKKWADGSKHIYDLTPLTETCVKKCIRGLRKHARGVLKNCSMEGGDAATLDTDESSSESGDDDVSPTASASMEVAAAPQAWPSPTARNLLGAEPKDETAYILRGRTRCPPASSRSFSAQPDHDNA